MKSKTKPPASNLSLHSHRPSLDRHWFMSTALSLSLSLFSLLRVYGQSSPRYITGPSVLSIYQPFSAPTTYDVSHNVHRFNRSSIYSRLRAAFKLSIKFPKNRRRFNCCNFEKRSCIRETISLERARNVDFFERYSFVLFWDMFLLENAVNCCRLCEKLDLQIEIYHSWRFLPGTLVCDFFFPPAVLLNCEYQVKTTKIEEITVIIFVLVWYSKFDKSARKNRTASFEESF